MLLTKNLTIHLLLNLLLTSLFYFYSVFSSAFLYVFGGKAQFFNGKENEQFPGKLEEIHCDTDNIKLEFLQRYGWLTDDYDVRVYSAKFKPKR